MMSAAGSVHADIIVVDDEADICQQIAGILTDEGFGARIAADGDAALAAIEDRLPTLVVLDIWLQGSRLDGLEILDILQRTHPDLPVIIISGHANIDMAVSAIRNGAYDFIEKPFKSDRLLHVVGRAIEAVRLRRENRDLRRRTGAGQEMIGTSPAINRLREAISQVAQTGSRVLISGPPGSGKELVARMIHNQSRRAAAPFIAINAATMEPDSMETELFGIEESSAGPRKTGVFEQAHGGTLFLDEVAEMPLATQGKIIRVLVEQNFKRVGGERKVQVDVRVMSSSARDLALEAADGRFREDLFHRLNVVPVAVPPLRERREDIPALVDHFMTRIRDATGMAVRTISDDAMAVLQAHDWPGNVRQLRNNIERLMILAGGTPSGGTITADLLPAEIGDTMLSTGSGAGNGADGEHIMGMPLRDARKAFERDYILAQIRRFSGNISQTAAFIGMERSGLHRKLRDLGIEQDDMEQP